MSRSIRLLPEAIVALDGYRGDGVCRIVRIERVEGGRLFSVDLLRSTPTHPHRRVYRLDCVDGVRPVVGQVQTED
jgi:hypothetical protein